MILTVACHKCHTSTNFKDPIPSDYPEILRCYKCNEPLGAGVYSDPKPHQTAPNPHFFVASSEVETISVLEAVDRLIRIAELRQEAAKASIHTPSCLDAAEEATRSLLAMMELH